MNAALGQLVLLIDTLATYLKMEFQGFKLYPMGSFSKIEVLEPERSVFELYNFHSERIGTALLT
jgi:beclin 1